MIRPMILLLLGALLIACGSSPTLASDGGHLPDGGAAMDGGVLPDGGALDGGTTPDGGGASDGGATTDGGMATDGGALDGGPPDAGWPDGGDISTPYPIDRGGQPGAPTTYQGLALGLTSSRAPTVTAVDGIIGVVCVGMSNGNQECADFITKLDRGDFAGEISSSVRFVNCAVGGHAIERWNDPDYDATLWDACTGTKLGARGVRADQVRVLWHKAADQFTTRPGGGARPPYPARDSDYYVFLSQLAKFADRVALKLPSVQAVYTSSRSYGGFATNAASRGEPLSYEEGHALNTWLAANTTVSGVWYGWGPYLWAPDCTSGEANGSGVCYDRADYQADGVHPAQGARDKVTQMLHDRLRQETWYQP